MIEGVRIFLQRVLATVGVQRDAVRGSDEEEREFHIEMATQRNMERGMPRVAARRHALMQFGGADRFDEEIRDVERVRWLEDAAMDVRLSLRMLRRSPAFAAAAVLTLALGIGANTSIFSVMNAVLLRPLPYLRPNELVSYKPERYDIHQDLARAASIVSAGAYTYASGNVAADDEPVRVWTLAVTSSLLPTLGVNPALGRNFNASDDVPGGPPHAMLRYEFWKRHFGGDANVVGRTVRVDGAAYEVIGVLPESLEFPAPSRRNDGSMPTTAELWTGVGVLDDLNERGGFYAVARAAPGSSIARVQSEIDAIAATRSDRDLPPAPIVVASVPESVTAPVRPAVLIFTAGVALVLLVACANLGSLLLARLSGRSRELAVRTSLGSSRGRMMRQIMTEGAVIAGLGGVFGVATGWGFLAMLIRWAPPEVPRIHEARIDAAVLLHAITISALTALLIGLFPALRASRGGRVALIGSSRGSVGDRGTRSAHRALVLAEVAFSVVLLVGASLLLRSYRALSAVSPGFDTNALLTMDVHLPDDRYATRADVLQFFDRAERSIAALPGVRSVSAIDRLPYGPSFSRIPFGIAGVRAADDPDAPIAYNASARPGYFATIGIPMQGGREFRAADVTDGDPVVVVSSAAARRYWPAGNAIGARVNVFGKDRTVVGIAGDVRHFGPTAAVDPMIYLPQSQDAATRRGMTIVVRAKTDGTALLSSMRSVMHDLDAQLPISNLRAFDALRRQRTAGERFTTLLITSFATLAALLAAVGIYGVTTFSVAQRRREIGVRMALGANRVSVLHGVIGEALKAAAPGALLGAAIAVPLVRFVQSQLFGVPALDALSFACAVTLILFATIAAAAAPAARAASVDPRVALSE